MADPKISVVPIGAAQVFMDAMSADPARSLGDVLVEAPAYAVGAPFAPNCLTRAVGRMSVLVLARDKLAPDVSLFPPPGYAPNGAAVPGEAEPNEHAADAHAAAAAASALHPTTPLQHRDVVGLAYQDEIRKLATFLRSRLSVLVVCEKLIAPFLQQAILRAAWVPRSDGAATQDYRLEPVILQADANAKAGPLGGPSPLQQMRDLIEHLKDDQILVIPHLDLLAGGGESNLGREARELTEVIYSGGDRLILAFADPSLSIAEVIAARFAVRVEVQGLPRDVAAADGTRVHVGRALVTADEAALFAGFDPAELYKNVAGLNPVRLRQAIAYAVQVARDEGHDAGRPAPLGLLKREVRAFKAQTAEQFTIPNIKFDDIGGYADVKAVLLRALALMMGAGSLPDETLRSELIPRGFLFHGPPGTGKTLFAKAIANQINATIRVVSGPEVTDMYVGESERKVRAIFAEARRNAPSVIVFDEFDSIAAERTGRDDGGSRAGNALVAQILTEMDGFRPDVPMLVVGTTNRLELIDRALLRPSRFQPVAIELPKPDALRQIAEIHARHFKLDVDPAILDEIAHAAAGFNGDEVRSLFRDAFVGMYCQSPQQPPDAFAFGRLVGAIRSRKDGEKLAATQYRPHNPHAGRRAPSGAMVALVPAAASPHAALASPPADPAAIMMIQDP